MLDKSLKIFPCKELDAYLKVLKPYLEAEDLKKNALGYQIMYFGFGMVMELKVRGINQDVY